MCLGDLGQVLEVAADGTALVRTQTRTLTVSLLTLEAPVAPGDWVVCHSGFALGRVTAEEAMEATAIRAGVPDPTTMTDRNTEDRP